MKVSDLIELLKRQPPDLRVILKGYENGYADISGLRERSIKLDVNPQWWNGPHEAAEATPDETAIELVRIDRNPGLGLRETPRCSRHNNRRDVRFG